ncbi:hypothetical protein [Thermoflexus sp.]|uniref:hypothetical protein n=1 Tax=Thermoflexus sp. TaxID=1969742 RepID=UPI0033219142
MRIARFAIRSSLPIGSGLLLVGLLAAGMLAMASRETPAARAQGPGLITHTTVADFQAPCAISSNISVGNVAGGELHLTASVEDDFDGATVDTTRWITDISNPAAGPTQSLLIANGRITLNGVYLRSVLTLTQLPRFFEARARLMQAPNTSGSVDLGFYRERGPLYNPPSRTSSIRLFILGNGDPNNLIARARDDGGDIVDVDIPDPDVTQFHVFRIEWEPGATRYYIDGSLATVIPSVTTVVTSWVFLYHQTPISYGTTPMDIDWVRAGQYALNGTYTSCPQDAGQQVQWTTISWDATVTGVTALAVRVRTSSDGVSWSSWSNPLPSGPNNIPAALAFARYLQYRVEMTTTNPMFSPEVREIAIGYNELADLAVSKSAAPDPVLAGEWLTYTIRITNNGPLAAAAVRVTDTLPGGVTLLSASASQGTCSGPVCDLGTLAAGATAVVTLSARMNANTPAGPLTNTVVVGTNTPDDPANNTATATTTIQTQADLAVAMADDPDPVIAGNPLTYTVQVTNAGPSDAQNTRILLTLPDGLTILGFAPSQGSCTGTTCNLGTLPAGSTATVVVRARVNPSVPPGTSNAQAQATTDTTDPNPNNNTATATTTIQTQADLAVAMADDPDPVIAGNPLTYTVQVTNAGPSDAQNTRILLTLPDGLTILGFAPSQGSCTGTTCNLGTLPAGSTATVVVRARVNPSVPPGTSNAQAQATTDTTDPNPNNNTATATTTVTVEADLHLSMSGTPDRIFVGEIVTYTLVVTNAGPSAAPNATISFTLPAGMRVERASSLCSVETARCNLGTLPVGGEITITLEVRAERWTASTVVMRAEARSDGMDPTPATAEVPTAVWLRLFLPFVSRGG